MRLLSVLLICAVAAIAGCDSRSGTPTPAPTASRQIEVLATVYPLAEIVQQIGGDHVNVQWLCEGGQRPEDLEINAALKQRANKVALVMTSGPWDDWTGSELGAEARAARLVEPGRMPAAAAGADLKAYLWLDPPVVREMADAARLRLTVVDTGHERDFREGAARVTAEIDQVDRAFRDDLARFAGKTVLAVRPSWAAMCARYRLKLVTPVDVIETKLTAEDFRTLSRAARAQNVKTIFVDESTPAAVRQQIAERTGLTPLTLDALGTSAPDGRSTWAKVMRYDLEQLKKGLE